MSFVSEVRYVDAEFNQRPLHVVNHSRVQTYLSGSGFRILTWLGLHDHAGARVFMLRRCYGNLRTGW